ncbi:MAG: TetR/AcrR family transcriptional regulator [Sulfitobacter sp.]
MKKPIQKRTLETRSRLIAVATDLVSLRGYDALRVEEVVQGAGVAKGTFFAHFRDKDALMDLLIGSEIDRHLDVLDSLPSPRNVTEMVDALLPSMNFMTSERYVFDVILRYSGAAMSDEIGTIATTFGRHLDIVARWLGDGPFRRDVTAQMLAEGVQAFAVQVMALHFCALHNDVALSDRLTGYLNAWLLDQNAL